MANMTDMNIVLGQGSAIKEVHNARKQSLELNQQLIAQKTEDKKREDKKRVQEFDADNKIHVTCDEEKKGGNSMGNNKKNPERKKSKEEMYPSDHSLIDIKV